MLSPSASPPLFCGMRPPDGGGDVFVVGGGGGGGGALFVVVGGGAGVGVGADVVVGGGDWLVVVWVTGGGVGGERTITTSLMCTCGLEASVTLRSWRPAVTPWKVIVEPALRLTEPSA